jgi:hydrogenase nickel insertion protein HypA
MHEFSISQQIVDVVLRTLREQEARLVERVVVVIGELALLNEDQVRFWVEEMFSKKPQTCQARLEIILNPALVQCAGCGFQGPPPMPGPEAHFLTPVLICPHCGQAGMAIREGRECLVKTITLKK